MSIVDYITYYEDAYDDGYFHHADDPYGGSFGDFNGDSYGGRDGCSGQVEPETESGYYIVYAASRLMLLAIQNSRTSMTRPTISEAAFYR